jgi:hypothetical protein
MSNWDLIRRNLNLSRSLHTMVLLPSPQNLGKIIDKKEDIDDMISYLSYPDEWPTAWLGPKESL